MICLPSVILTYDDGGDGGGVAAAAVMILMVVLVTFSRLQVWRIWCLQRNIFADNLPGHIRQPQDKSLQFHAKSKQNESI